MKSVKTSNVVVFFRVTSFLAFILCLINDLVDKKEVLFLIPLSFFLMTFLFKKNYQNITDNIPKLMILAMYWVRNVVLIAIYSFTSEYTLFEGSVSIDQYTFQASLLLVYEFFIANIVIYLFEHTRHKTKKRITIKSSSFDLSNIAIIGIFCFILGISFLKPQYASSFKTILNLGDSEFTIAYLPNEYNVGSIARIFRTLYSLCFQIFRILFPAYLLLKIYKKKRDSVLVKPLLVLMCVAQLFFLTSTFAEAIVSCFTLILFYIKLYPEKQKKTFFMLFISSAGLIILYFTVRFFVNTGPGLYNKNEGISLYAGQIINAYFTGVDNVAAVFNVDRINIAEALKADLLGAIPFNNTFFGDIGKKLQYFYNYYNGAYGQIPPTIGAGYYYFGWFFSPIITALFINRSLHYNYLASSTTATLKYIPYIFCSVIFALGTVMYSPAITLQWFCSWGLIMMAITFFTVDK